MREKLRDLAGLAGAVAIMAGIWLRLGTWAGLIAGGVFLLGFVAYDTWIGD